MKNWKKQFDKDYSPWLEDMVGAEEQLIDFISQIEADAYERGVRQAYGQGKQEGFDIGVYKARGRTSRFHELLHKKADAYERGKKLRDSQLTACMKESKWEAYEKAAKVAEEMNMNMVVHKPAVEGMSYSVSQPTGEEIAQAIRDLKK